MATYILFWNPDISSSTKDRFLADFAEEENVGNWSFHEHEDVGYGDTFYMMKCGGGKCGLVMRGTITSSAYEDSDWSPKNRKHIFYADIEHGFTINPWSDPELLSPEFLTGELPPTVNPTTSTLTHTSTINTRRWHHNFLRIEITTDPNSRIARFP